MKKLTTFKIDSAPPIDFEKMNFQELLNILLDGSAITIQNFCDEVESVTGIFLEYETAKKWLQKGSKPRKQNWEAIRLLIQAACKDNDYEEAWLNALAGAMSRKKTSTSIKKKENSTHNNATRILSSLYATKLVPLFEKTNSIFVSITTKKFTIIAHSKINSLLAVSRSKLVFFVFIVVGGIVMVLFNQKLPTITTASVSASANQLNVPPPLPQERPKELATPHNMGLLMDVYLFQEKYKSLPSQPAGISLATVKHPNAGRFSFVDHYADNSVASTTEDRDMGLNYSGYIDIKQTGKHLFSMKYQSGRHLVTQIFKKCRIVVSIEQNILFNELTAVGLGEHFSRQDFTFLQKGKNKLNVWFTCNNLRGFSPKWDYDAFKDTVVTLSLKGPSDPKITVINQSNLSH